MGMMMMRWSHVAVMRHSDLLLLLHQVLLLLAVRLAVGRRPLEDVVVANVVLVAVRFGKGLRARSVV